MQLMILDRRKMGSKLSKISSSPRLNVYPNDHRQDRRLPQFRSDVNQFKLILARLLFVCLSISLLTSSMSPSLCPLFSSPESREFNLVFQYFLSGAAGQYLDGDKNSHSHESPRPPSYQSTGGAWISEELWPKEKSLIHVKLIKPVPREIEIWGARNKDNYLTDLNLDFESPYRTLVVDNCTLDFRSYYDGFTDLPNNADLLKSVGNIQLQISGGLNCIRLPFHVLNREEKENLTHVVIRDTGLRRITRFMFGASRLERLLRMDIIANRALSHISNRAFDGLNRMSYLALLNNPLFNYLDLEAFAGIKALEELIFIGNGAWNGHLLKQILNSAAERILPNLVHLHISGTTVAGIKIDPANLTGSQDDDHDPSENSARRSISSKKMADFNSVNVSKGSQHADDGSSDDLASGVKINKDDLKPVSQIKYLQLSECSLNYIHPSAFSPLVKKLIGLNLVSFIN